MIDLHAHILPGIDDGPGGLELAAAICRRAAADGCEAIAATPHQRHDRWWNADPARLAELRAELQEAVGERPKILAGAEIRIGPGLLGDLDRADLGGLVPLAGSRYLLLEFPRDHPPRSPVDLVHEVVVAGWRPVLAHPELIWYLSEDLDTLARLEEAGALFQLTAMSLTGGFGGRIARRSQALVRAGLVHFLASDCHDLEHRPPGLAAARAAAAEIVGEAVADRLVSGNPRAVRADRSLRLVAAS